MTRNYGFFQCDRCIGITPCKILRTGKILCDYCKNEVRTHTFVGPISIIKTTRKVQQV